LRLPGDSVRLEMYGVPTSRLQEGVAKLKRGPSSKGQVVGWSQPLGDGIQTVEDLLHQGSRSRFPVAGVDAALSAVKVVVIEGPFYGQRRLLPISAAIIRDDDAASVDVHAEIVCTDLGSLRAQTAKARCDKIFREMPSMSEEKRAQLIGVPRTSLQRTFEAPAQNASLLSKVEQFASKYGVAGGIAVLTEKYDEMLVQTKATKRPLPEDDAKVKMEDSGAPLPGATQGNENWKAQGNETWNDYAESYLQTFMDDWIAAKKKEARVPIHRRILAGLDANKERYGQHTLDGVRRKMENTFKRRNAPKKQKVGAEA